MAQIAVDGDELVVRLSPLERVGAFHRDVRISRSCVREVRATRDAWSELRGIRAPGTGIPKVIALGTRRGSFGRDFAAVRGVGPALVVELDGAPFSRLVVSCADPDSTVTALRA